MTTLKGRDGTRGNGLAPHELFAAAVSLRVDRLAITMTTELAARRISTIVMKGPAIGHWLYADGSPRVYGDLDLLIGSSDWERARDLLLELGFEDSLAELAHPRMESVASYAYRRGPDEVDLHTTFYGIPAPPERVWEVLSARTASLSLAGSSVTILAPGPRAMQLALHAAQHGPAGAKPLEDLLRGIRQLDMTTWREAAETAAVLGATGTFATGLGLVAGGDELAAKLGIAGARSPSAALRVAGVPLAEGLESLRLTPGIAAKLRLARSEIFPTPAFMRWWLPLARRGRGGLLAAYLWRPLYLALHTPRAVTAWMRARRGA